MVLLIQSTLRSQTAYSHVSSVIIVTGGDQDTIGDYLNNVEALDTEANQWTTLSPLPRRCSALSPAFNGGGIYRAVFTCFLSDIEKKIKKNSVLRTLTRSHWKKLIKLSVSFSTLATFGGDLLANGGMMRQRNSQKVFTSMISY